MLKDYIVITLGEDGDVDINQWTKPALLGLLDQYIKDCDKPPTIHPYLPHDSDIQSWEPGMYIIKGQPVVPKQKETVTKYDI